MDANYALEDYEVARGYVLTCQSYPAQRHGSSSATTSDGRRP